MSAESSGGKNGGKGFLEKLAENEKYRKVIIGVGLVGIGLIFLFRLSEKREYGRRGGWDRFLAARGYGRAVRGPAAAESGADYFRHTGRRKRKGSRHSGADGRVCLRNRGKKEQPGHAGQIRNRFAENGDKRQRREDLHHCKGRGRKRAGPSRHRSPAGRQRRCRCLRRGDNPTVQQNITSAVTTALHISSIQVCVIKAK